MAPVRPDPLGILDLVSGVMLFYTVSALPSSIAHLHAGFLMLKGGGGMVRPVTLPTPVYVLGGAADVISAAILFTGRPPVLVGYKDTIAVLLFLKGVWTLMGFMQG